MIALNETELSEKLINLIKAAEPFIWVETEEIARATKLTETIISTYLLQEKAKNKEVAFTMWEYDLESGMFEFNWNETPKANQRRSLGKPVPQLQCFSETPAGRVRKTIPASKIITTTLDTCPDNTMVLIPAFGSLMDIAGPEEVMLASNITLKSTNEVVHTDARCLRGDPIVNTLTLRGSTIVAIGPRPKGSALEGFAKNQIHWLNLSRPTKQEHQKKFASILDSLLASTENKDKAAANDSLKKNEVKSREELTALLGAAAMGLTEYEMVQATYFSLQKLRYIDPKAISDARQEIINGTPGLKMVPYDAAKDWDRAKGFEKLKTLTGKVLNRKDRKGMGILLVGPPGCGKTLIAQAIAQTMKRIFIHLNIADMMDGSQVGNTEKNLNKALSVISRLGECVVLIDEAEKQLAGTVDTGKGGGGDNLAQRLGAALLSWENDRKSEAIIIKTANRPDQLAAEMIRRSPIKIFIDLPIRQARREIIAMYMKDEKIEGDNFDPEFISQLADETTGWSGDDIRNLIEMAAAFGNDFAMAKTYIRPQFETRADDIIAQRKVGKQLGTSLADKSFEDDCGEDIPLALKTGDFKATEASFPTGE